MKLVIKLVLAQWRHHAMRTLLALAAVVTSVAMVVVVIGGQTASVREPAVEQTRLVGDYTVLVTSGTEADVTGTRTRASVNQPLPPLEPEVVAWLHAQPEVANLLESCELVVEAARSRETYASSDRQFGATVAKHVITSMFGTANPTSPRPVAEGSWFGLTPVKAPASDAAAPVDAAVPGAPEGDAVAPETRVPVEPSAGDVVLDGDVAKKLKVKVGDSFQLATTAGWRAVTVVGILETPATIRGLTGIYATPGAFATLTGREMRVNRIMVGLQDGQSTEAFGDRCTEFIGTRKQPAQVERISAVVNAVALLAVPRGTGAWYLPLMRDVSARLAIIAGIFIIFNTFSMGVQERSRQLAMLRAIGMTRGQVLQTLLVEALALATVGWIVGVGLGWNVLRKSMTVASRRDGLKVNLDFDMGILIALGALTAYGAVLLATAIPAWLASRRRPLEGMSDAATLAPTRAPLWLVPLGVLCIATNPWAAFTHLIPDPFRSNVVVPLTFMIALAGMAMLLPWLLTACEGVFAQIAGRLLFLNPRMLRRQLSSNLWRTVGCVAALMVGLGLYIVIQVWGRSMAVPFLMSGQIPDAVAHVMPDGVPDDKVAALGQIDGVKQVLPIYLENAILTDLPKGEVINGIDFFSQDVMYMGCDLKAMLGPETGMIKTEFIRGDSATAWPQLDDGFACLVSDNLYNRYPDIYDVGKTITLDSADPDHKALVYTIAGVVKMDGWHLFMRYIGMRRNIGRVGGMVFVPAATAREAYPATVYRTFWFNLEEGKDPASLELPIIKVVDPSAKEVKARGGNRRGEEGRGRSKLDSATPAPDASTNKGTNATDTAAKASATTAAKAATRIDTAVYCRIVNSKAVGASLQKKVENVIRNLSTYPIYALLLASVAVLNTMFAAIRARSWEIGILRSIGQTRGQVVRLILAEGILIGLLAGVVSLIFGLGMAYTGIVAGCRSMDVTAPYLVPWYDLGKGIALAVGLCLVASIAPAFLIARREPLKLLQEGRAME